MKTRSPLLLTTMAAHMALKIEQKQEILEIELAENHEQDPARLIAEIGPSNFDQCVLSHCNPSLPKSVLTFGKEHPQDGPFHHFPGIHDRVCNPLHAAP